MLAGKNFKFIYCSKSNNEILLNFDCIMELNMLLIMIII